MSPANNLHSFIVCTVEQGVDRFVLYNNSLRVQRDEMIELIYSLRDSNDSIDWDAHRNNYDQAVKQSMSRSQQSSDEPQQQPQPLASKRALQAGGDDFDGDVFDQYEYSKGACPNSGSLGVPCAPDNLPLLCNKYNREDGSFRDCLDVCKPAFCCIHNAPRDLNYVSEPYCMVGWGDCLFPRFANEFSFNFLHPSIHPIATLTRTAPNITGATLHGGSYRIPSDQLYFCELSRTQMNGLILIVRRFKVMLQVMNS